MTRFFSMSIVVLTTMMIGKGVHAQGGGVLHGDSKVLSLVETVRILADRARDLIHKPGPLSDQEVSDFDRQSQYALNTARSHHGANGACPRFDAAPQDLTDSAVSSDRKRDKIKQTARQTWQSLKGICG